MRRSGIILKASQNDSAQIFGLLGHNISYSLSPAIHNHFFARRGINAVYGLFDIKPENFDSNVKSLISGTEGFNVTVPYKERIVPLLDGLKDEAEKTGSVNLVFNRVGYNTDYMALRDLVKGSEVFLKGKECTILGAGGAARTASYFFGELGMKLSIVNRSHEKGLKLQNDLNSAGYQAIYEEFSNGFSVSPLKSACVVNCISSSEVSYPQIDAEIVIDFNYGQKSQAFRKNVRNAEKLISGEEILITQAIHSQRIWNQVEPSYEELAEVLNVQ